MKEANGKGTHQPGTETEKNRQPKSVQNDAPGYGDKKLEGPNRPST